MEVSLKSAKNNRYFTRRPVYIFDHISPILLIMRCFRHPIEKIRTHISVQYPPSPLRKLWRSWNNVKKIIVEPLKPQMTIWRLRIACCIRKATNTHVRTCNTYCFSTAIMVARTHLSFTSYIYTYIHTYIACLACIRTVSNVKEEVVAHLSLNIPRGVLWGPQRVIFCDPAITISTNLLLIFVCVPHQFKISIM